MLNTCNSQTLETRATHRVRIISRKYGVTYTVRSLKIQSQKYSIAWGSPRAPFVHRHWSTHPNLVLPFRHCQSAYMKSHTFYTHWCAKLDHLQKARAQGNALYMQFSTSTLDLKAKPGFIHPVKRTPLQQTRTSLGSQGHTGLNFTPRSTSLRCKP